MLQSLKFFSYISMVLNLNCCYSISANRCKQKDCFNEKTCIKACLEIEKSQVVCCSHPQNIYFMLNSNRIFHCASHILQICESFCLYFILCASQTKCVFFSRKPAMLLWKPYITIDVQNRGGN